MKLYTVNDIDDYLSHRTPEEAVCELTGGTIQVTTKGLIDEDR